MTTHTNTLAPDQDNRGGADRPLACGTQGFRCGGCQACKLDAAHLTHLTLTPEQGDPMTATVEYMRQSWRNHAVAQSAITTAAGGRSTGWEAPMGYISIRPATQEEIRRVG